MSEEKKIRVEMYNPGVGREAHEWEHCPIMKPEHHDICPIGGGVCKYGLTEIEPPKSCPIRNGLEMKFTLV